MNELIVKPQSKNIEDCLSEADVCIKLEVLNKDLTVSTTTTFINTKEHRANVTSKFDITEFINAYLCTIARKDDAALGYKSTAYLRDEKEGWKQWVNWSAQHNNRTEKIN